jgi:hypothetical protein
MYIQSKYERKIKMNEEKYEKLLKMEIHKQALIIHRLIGFIEAKEQFKDDITPRIILNKIEEMIERC